MIDFPKEINIGGRLWYIIEANIEFPNYHKKILSLKLIDTGKEATTKTKTLEQILKPERLISMEDYK